jgi:peptide/nickel transport system substrate-binding protein
MQSAAALGLSAGLVSMLAEAAAAAPFAGPSGLAKQAQDGTPTAGGVLKVGLQADPTALDMQSQSLTAIAHVIEHIYEGLVAIAPDLTPAPSLAESWEISEDGTVYTFKLRQGVKFHDGTDLKAEDVLFTFNRLVDPATASTSASNLASVVGVEEFVAGTTETVEGIKIVDPATIEITLKAPDASFLTVLGAPVMTIMSQAFVEANNGDVSQVANGTGPFKFVEYVPNTSVKLEKHTEYWREDQPYLDGLEMFIVPEDTARTTSLIQGATDFIEYAPLRNVDSLMENSDLTVAGDANTNIRYISFNFDEEPFDKLQVRQAIAKVVDRTPMIDSAVFGHGKAVGSIFPPDFWAGLTVEIAPPDIEGAKALLAEAGVPDGFDTVITSWSQYSFLSNAAVVVQEQLKQIGINAELNLVENATMVADVHIPASKNFQIGVTGQSAIIDPHPFLLPAFGTDGSSNTTGYSNPDVDALLEQGMVETDLEARAEIYRNIQEILINDAPWVSLFVANQYEAMKADVKGYVHVPTGTNVYLRETWLDR